MGPIQELCKKRVAFGAWCVFQPEILDEARCRRVRESGLDFGYIGISADHHEVKDILDACEKAGLMAIFHDPAVELHADQAYRLPRVISDYKDHPAFAGVCLRDEPGVNDFSRLKLLSDAFVKAAPDKTPSIDLYPIYANSDQLNGVSYEEYVNRFADEVADDVIGYDFYPLYGIPGGETWLQDNYLRNFEIVARACKRKGCDMWYFIQTLCFNRFCREPSEKDIRWQMFCALSFGTKVIELFTYGTPDNGAETFEDSMIGRDGNITPRYTAVQKVIGEMNRFTGSYVSYHWEGAMTYTGNLVPEGRDVELVFPDQKRMVHLRNNYMELDHPLESFCPILCFEGSQPLLIGCFTKEDSRAFTLVNMADPGRNLPNRAVIRFNGAKTLLVHGKDGDEEIFTNGCWVRELASGEGLFVEIL